MKSMTLSTRYSVDLLQAPSAVVVGGAPFPLQLLQMGTHVFLRGRHERGRETIIDGFSDRLHGGVSALQRIEHLLFALKAMRDVAGEDRLRVVNRRTVRREQQSRLE